MSDHPDEACERHGWIRRYSKTKNRTYLLHLASGKSMWTIAIDSSFERIENEWSTYVAAKRAAKRAAKQDAKDVERHNVENVAKQSANNLLLVNMTQREADLAGKKRKNDSGSSKDTVVTTMNSDNVALSADAARHLVYQAEYIETYEHVRQNKLAANQAAKQAAKQAVKQAAFEEARRLRQMTTFTPLASTVLPEDTVVSMSFSPDLITANRPVNADEDAHTLPPNEVTAETLAEHIDKKCSEITQELDSMRVVLDEVNVENNNVACEDLTTSASVLADQPKIRWKKTIKLDVVGGSKSNASPVCKERIISHLTDEVRHVRPKLTQKIPPVAPHQVRPKQTIKTHKSLPPSTLGVTADSRTSENVLHEMALPTLRYKVKSSFGLKPMSASNAAVAQDKLAKLGDTTMLDTVDDVHEDGADLHDCTDMYSQVANMCDDGDDDDIFQDNIQKESSDEDDDTDATFTVPTPRSRKKKVA
jgi:hypothetical protein